jgi:hypothetical protein
MARWNSRANSIGVAARVAIGLIYVPMSVEYMAQYFKLRASRLYLRFICGNVSLNSRLTSPCSSAVCLSSPRLAAVSGPTPRRAGCSGGAAHCSHSRASSHSSMSANFQRIGRLSRRVMDDSRCSLTDVAARDNVRELCSALR